MPSKLVLLSWGDADPLFPSNALPGGGYPSQGLPGAPAYPSQGLPPGAVQLPVFPFDPTEPPVATQPPMPGQLPSPGGPPPPVASQPIAPGGRYIVKWLACVGLILVPDHTLPPTAAPK
jgi:hypothetical protein